MLGVLVAVLVVELVPAVREAVPAGTASVLWVVFGLLIVLTLRVVETRAARAAVQTSEVREIRDLTRKIAGTVGRMASGATTASSTQGPDRAALAERAARGEGLRQLVGRSAATPPPGSEGWGRLARRPLVGAPVAVVGEVEVVATLAAVARVVVLRPGRAVATFDVEQPRAVVLDRAALATGAWFGVESPMGAALADELAEVSRRARAAGVTVYWLEAAGSEGPGTTRLRELADVLLPGETDPSGEGAPQSALRQALERLSEGRPTRGGEDAELPQ